MPETPLLSLDRVSLSLPTQDQPVHILHDITADFLPAQSVAITGPSGSGKTSLMMICAGLLRPTSGNIAMNGQTISGLDEEALSTLRRQQIGIVFQNFHLIPSMTALENVAVALELDNQKEGMSRAANALEQVGLGHRLTHYPAQLSGGEQQRVAIARAIVRNPHILLADEPTGNLDQATGQHIIDLLFNTVRDLGTTLLLITHDPKLAHACDRQLHLVDGKLAS
jgi:putative ABC transport system ATP-binding protein